MKEKLKTGDQVRLQVGGPVMTVCSAFDPLNVSCQWFVGRELREDTFATESLEADND